MMGRAAIVAVPSDDPSFCNAGAPPGRQSRLQTARSWRNLGELMARVLVFSTLFPNAAQPNHGIFVENRLRETLALGGLDADVLAPAPYFPSAHPMFGRYAAFARVPRGERRHGVDVFHPAYLLAPRLGQWLGPAALYRAGLAAARRLMAQGRRWDVIDAHYFYPDGVAAARLARTLRLPLVITGRGTDLTLLARAPGPREQIRRAAGEASALVGVCEDLRRRIVELGAPEGRTLTLRNGVDLAAFRPGDRPAARARLGVSGFVAASVGALIERKGHDLAIEAVAACPDMTLVIAGGGPLRAQLEALAGRLGVAARVCFLGDVPHRELPDIYTAADALILASSREGWANVLLEAMACGAPVVATDVNGAAEVVRSPAAGLLTPERTADALVRTLARLRAAAPSRAATRAYAEAFGWRPVALANRALLTAAAAAGYARRHDPDIVMAARALVAAPEERCA
jgi:glycosyltransferase involved in cell wall biosynthesis